MRKKNSGLTLLELIIGLSLIAMVMVGVIRMQMRQQDMQMGVLDADRLKTFQQLAAQFLLSNKSGILAALGAPNNSDPNVQKYCRLWVDNPSRTMIAWSGANHTCMIDASLMNALNAWPASLGTNYDYYDNIIAGDGKWRYVAIFRGVVSSSGSLTGDIEMLVVRATWKSNAVSSDANKPQLLSSRNTRMLQALSVLGQNGGFTPLTNMGNCDPNHVCGQGWNVYIPNWVQID